MATSLVTIVVGAAMFFLPDMTRHAILFGLAVPNNFRHTARACRSIAEFRMFVAVALIAVLIGIFVSPIGALNAISVAGPMLMLLIGCIGFVWQHRRLKPFAIEPLGAREVVVTNVPERLPWFVWLALGPFAILAAAAVFLSRHWKSIPATFPVHWGINGQPNAWSNRTVHGVYGLLLMGAAVVSCMLILAFAIWFGARRSRFRRVTFGALIAIEYMQALLLSAVAVAPIVHLPGWVMPVIPLVFIVPMLFAMARAITEPGGAPEPTPNECWKGGMIYFNPKDPALLVERRAGLGYTFNFGNPWSWVLLAMIVAAATTPLML